MVINDWFTTNLEERNKRVCDFQLTLNPYKFKSRGFHQDCTDAAYDIANRYDNVHLSYSGGLDSEFILNTFVDAKIPITPVIVKTEFNKEEFEFALKYCKSRNVNYKILEYEKKDFILKLHEKTHKRNLHALLGGLPLLINDYVKSQGGHLINGNGDPFTIEDKENKQNSHSLHLIHKYPENRVSQLLEFSEWDAYPEQYDSDNPNAFFNYNIPIMYSMIKEIDYDIPFQHAKTKLYGLEYRFKIFYSYEFQNIAHRLNDLVNPNITSCQMNKDLLISILDTYKI